MKLVSIRKPGMNLNQSCLKINVPYVYRKDFKRVNRRLHHRGVKKAGVVFWKPLILQVPSHLLDTTNYALSCLFKYSITELSGWLFVSSTAITRESPPMCFRYLRYLDSQQFDTHGTLFSDVFNPIYTVVIDEVPKLWYTEFITIDK